MPRRIPGIHHVTAIADPQRNLDFYVRGPGLRLVKRTVNFDDPPLIWINRSRSIPHHPAGVQGEKAAQQP